MSVAKQQLLSIPTDELLGKFGAGSHVPGSGCAAAFSGILACQLCLAVVRLTNDPNEPERREKYSNVLFDLERIEEHIVKILLPALENAFEKDAEVFDKVIITRKMRDAEPDPERKKYLNDQALILLQPATKLMLEVCEYCLVVCEHAIYLFDYAFQSVRGDSGAAARIALAGANSAVFISYLNLKLLKQWEEADALLGECDALLQQSDRLHTQLSSRINKLRTEATKAIGVAREAEITSQVIRIMDRTVAPPTRELKRSQPENLSLFPEDVSEPVAARITPMAINEEPQVETMAQVAEPQQGDHLSDEEVFANEFGKYARGKNKDVWFETLHEFFITNDLGSFASRLEFLRFLRATLDAHRYPVTRVFDTRKLLKWFKESQTERSVGSKL